MVHKINPIEEYFKDVGNQKQNFSELFEAYDDDLEVKTDLSDEKIVLITTLYENDEFLKEIGLKPVFKSYYEKQMRLLISKERKSRAEFVEVNKAKKELMQDKINDAMNGLIKK